MCERLKSSRSVYGKAGLSRSLRAMGDCSRLCVLERRRRCYRGSRQRKDDEVRVSAAPLLVRAPTRRKPEPKRIYRRGGNFVEPRYRWSTVPELSIQEQDHYSAVRYLPSPPWCPPLPEATVIR